MNLVFTLNMYILSFHNQRFFLTACTRLVEYKFSNVANRFEKFKLVLTGYEYIL